MRDVSTVLQPDETVAYQTAYRTWQLIVYGLVAIIALAISVVNLLARNRENDLLAFIFLILFALWTYFFFSTLHEYGSRFVVTNRRIMHLSAKPGADEIIPYQDLSEVNPRASPISPHGCVIVSDRQNHKISIPVYWTNKRGATTLANQINTFRSVIQGAPAEQ